MLECRALKTLTVRLVASRSCRSCALLSGDVDPGDVGLGAQSFRDRRHLRHLSTRPCYFFMKISEPTLVGAIRLAAQ